MPSLEARSGRLIDLGYSGNPFTWTNRRPVQAKIRERLDRGLANSQWCILFPNARIRHLPAHNSDHNPILLDTFGNSFSDPKPYKFLSCWTRDRTCSTIVKHAWNIPTRGSPPFKLCQKIRNTRKALKTWNQTHFGHIETKIRILNEVIDKVQTKSPTSRNLEKELHLQVALDEELKREEAIWWEKSRHCKIIEGDTNTRFFHLTTITRRRRNALDYIRHEGNWITDRKEIGKCFTEHFSKVFTSSTPVIPHDLENLILPSISTDDNNMLCSMPSEQEITQALSHLGSHKVPGPDGMTGLFYKTYWKTIKKDVINRVLTFFNSGYLLQEQNHAHIALIPKLESPTSVSHYWPISLCNLSYKIISKIMASRLKSVLHTIISPLQATFVPNRLINDNSLLVQELWHIMRNKKGKNGLMAKKINMEKAYDKLEWPFILQVLRRELTRATRHDVIAVWLKRKNVPNLKPYGGAREARRRRCFEELYIDDEEEKVRRVKNFLWHLKRCFEALEMDDEEEKVQITEMYLADRTRLPCDGDVATRILAIFREKFKRKLKRQIYQKSMKDLVMINLQSGLPQFKRDNTSKSLRHDHAKCGGDKRHHGDSPKFTDGKRNDNKRRHHYHKGKKYEGRKGEGSKTRACLEVVAFTV
ncbi:hypothetical protein RJ639_007120 [Escallonia herrerae]|uniref:Reverse transcriptase domain-containing protein n=1 Tax=Escallonia herrerae TaxID=1293975 RepID=A0AA89AVW0_9ASTE|nr:hypothetical protein RJ639_007120 [Escallonia herrerae]